MARPIRSLGRTSLGVSNGDVRSDATGRTVAILVIVSVIVVEGARVDAAARGKSPDCHHAEHSCTLAFEIAIKEVRAIDRATRHSVAAGASPTRYRRIDRSDPRDARQFIATSDGAFTDIEIHERLRTKPADEFLL